MNMKKTLIKMAFLISVLTLSAFFSSAASNENKQYRVPRVMSKVKPDGILNEEVWKKALVLELNYEVEPGENIKPPVKTEVLLAYSKTHFYVAFRAFDPDPSQIHARISDRDDLGNQDWVAVILDTFNDERRSYDLTCNPLGVQADLIETPDGNAPQWDAIWDSGGRINNQGYFVEMSIPFSSLGFQRKEGEQVWGLDVVRSYPRSVRHHIGLFPRDRNNNCYLCQSVKLIGFEGAKPGKNLEFDPTLFTHISHERENELEGPFVKDERIDAGLTVRWGFTPNLTLSAAVNPDFSQVEADALELDINEPFALFYPEKRPFFNEGGDFFNTPLNAVYTRTLRDPTWGIKLTGKEGSHTIGAYMVRDTLTNLIFPGSQGSNATSLSMNSTSAVLCYRRDFGNKYKLGALLTHRYGQDYLNSVLGFDGDLRFSSRDRIRMQLMGSSTRYPNDTAAEFDQPHERFNDKALDILYVHDARNLDWHVGYRDIGEKFRADLGFIPQVGFRSFFGGTAYVWYAKPGQWWTQFSLEGNYEQVLDSNGPLLNRDSYIKLTYLGPMEMYSYIDFTSRREAYNGMTFDQDQLTLNHCMNPMGNMKVGMNLILGDRIDYANTRLGKRIRLSPYLLYDIGLHVHLYLSHKFERMQVGSERLYTANQSELHLAYQLNKRTFLRTILQYVDYRYNIAMYSREVDPEYRHLFTQILFSYKINPQTVLFLGYSDNYLGYVNTGLPQVNRTIFLKLGYALVI
jgi:hypothetical protein